MAFINAAWLTIKIATKMLAFSIGLVFFALFLILVKAVDLTLEAYNATKVCFGANGSIKK